MSGRWVPWELAWHGALYGPDGFYRREQPRDHFSTSAQYGRPLAELVYSLALRVGAERVLDLGAGSGELVAALHDVDAEIEVLAVDLRPRPDGLPATVGWAGELPAQFDGLLVAHEYLDNVACAVVELDRHDVVRHVEVDVDSGEERLGEPADADVVAWLERWWPLSRTSGQPRAEIGLNRERVWSDIVRRLGNGVALAVDYGHMRGHRPASGSLRAFRGGRVVDPVPNGRCDLTAHVAVDALATAVGGALVRQREVVVRCAAQHPIPSYDEARADPIGAVRMLSRAGTRAVLSAPGGLGDFWWLVTPRGTADVGAWPT
jgi:SAM-dependent MidA family methyltransferase